MYNTPALQIKLLDCHRRDIHDISDADVSSMRQRYPYSLDAIAYVNGQPIHIERLYENQESRDHDATPGMDYCRHDYELLFVLAITPLRVLPTPRDLAAAAGYYRHIDVERLTDDLRRYPGCEDLKARNMQNYLARKTKMPFAVIQAFAAVTGHAIDTIMKAVKQ